MPVLPVHEPSSRSRLMLALPAFTCFLVLGLAATAGQLDSGNGGRIALIDAIAWRARG